MSIADGGHPHLGQVAKTRQVPSARDLPGTDDADSQLAL